MNDKQFRILIACMGLVFLTSFMSMCNSCNNSDSISKLGREIKMNDTISSTRYVISLKIEGLKSEARAIQASDRKILDINRLSEINKSIIILEKDLEKYK